MLHSYWRVCETVDVVIAFVNKFRVFRDRCRDRHAQEPSSSRCVEPSVDREFLCDHFSTEVSGG